MGAERPPANRMTLQTFKGRLGGAKKGHSLLKKKRDALKAKFQGILKDIVDAKLKVGEGLKEANFALAKSNWASTGDITSTVIERCSKPSVTCSMKNEGVAGVAMPVFKANIDASKADPGTIGIGQGGAMINATRAAYFEAVQQLVRLASLQCMFTTLDLEIKMTGRRVNALEFVVIPRIQEIVDYVVQEIDEMAREEFFRVKKVVDKKKIRHEKERAADLLEQAEKEAKKATKQAGSAIPGGDEEAKRAPRPASQQASALPTADEDVVFK